MENIAPEFDQTKMIPYLELDNIETRISTVEDLKQRYPKQFDVIGHFEGEYHIKTDPSVPPAKHAMRKTPIEYQEKIAEQLDKLEAQKVIIKVTEPTDWVNSMTYPIKPDGEPRICIDCGDLNEAIVREYYKPPTLEEITHKLSGAKVFSKVDAYKGFFACRLDYESSLKTTFNSIPTKGRYRYLCMPMGAKCSQDAFQMKMDEILEGLNGIIAIHDDITIFGKTEEEHDINLIAFMDRAAAKGLTLNSKKCHIKQKSVSFFGFMFSEDGTSPDPKKIQGIIDMPSPQDTTQLQSFLGMVNFMHPFIPHLSANTAPLRQLLSKNAVFQWTPSTELAFQRLKDLIIEAQNRSLKFYDRSKPLKVQADASKDGLGAALLQDDQPIAFASKSLSDAEKRYANIERELLAVVFACERFRIYLLGREFIIESDHKPLEMIALKRMMAAPPRLQRLLLRLQPFDCKIKYRPGKEMLLPDALSRLPSTENTQIHLDLRIEHHGFTTARIQQISTETQEDPILGLVYQFTLDGWPHRRNRVPRIARRYWDQRDELSTDHGLLMKGPRIVIPTVQRERTLGNLHVGHQGITAMQQMAKTTVYWPGIDADIEDWVQRCTACLSTKPNQKREPLLPHKVPDAPWQKIGADFFDFEGQKFLLVIDYFSKFIFVERVSTTTAKSTINKFSNIFATEGAPQQLMTDNGPPFNSGEFSRFCQEWNLEHRTSSPNYPQSDGQAERAVQTVKQRMARCKQDGQDFKQALLQMRTTPISKDLPSPFEILHGRPARTVNGQAEQRELNMTEVKQKLLQRQEKTAEHYNKRHAVRELPPLHEQQRVLIQHREGNWEPATVKQVGPEPRSYLCETPTGKTFRRNRKHIQSTGMPNCNKTCLKQKTEAQTAPKRVNWAQEAYITADAETAYFAATQGIDLSVSEAEQPDAAVAAIAAPIAPDDAVAAPIQPPVAVLHLDHREGEEDDQSHHSDSEREGNAEESLLTPDEQVAGVVSAKAPETRPSAVPDSGEEDEHPEGEEHSGEQEQPRRSRRKRKKICYQPFAQRKSKPKQKSQAK